jgi:hypothetical protein
MYVVGMCQCIGGYIPNPIFPYLTSQCLTMPCIFRDPISVHWDVLLGLIDFNRGLPSTDPNYNNNNLTV